MSGELKLLMELRDLHRDLRNDAIANALEVAVTALSPAPAPGALPELPDMHENNKALCSFTQRWRVDGDYIRCGTCDRPQLTTFADKPFPHADFCRVKDSPSMERTPWLTYVGLLAPLSRAYAEQCRAGVVGEWMPKESAPKDGKPFVGISNYMTSFNDPGMWIVVWDAKDEQFVSWYDREPMYDLTGWHPLHIPALQSAFADDEGVKRG